MVGCGIICVGFASVCSRMGVFYGIGGKEKKGGVEGGWEQVSGGEYWVYFKCVYWNNGKKREEIWLALVVICSHKNREKGMVGCGIICTRFVRECSKIGGGGVELGLGGRKPRGGKVGNVSGGERNICNTGWVLLSAVY